jgi:hypothetical protein
VHAKETLPLGISLLLARVASLPNVILRCSELAYIGYPSEVQEDGVDAAEDTGACRRNASEVDGRSNLYDMVSRRRRRNMKVT